MSQRLFGTDGVRGVAGTWPLDPPTVARLGAAIVRAAPLGRPARIVVGRDTRESGVWIERELARGASAEGARVTSAGVVPTPAVAYLAGEFDFDLGVVLSASHNPYEDNGIKVFSGRGEKFGEEQERQVEGVMAEAWTVPDSLGTVESDGGLIAAYLDKVQRLYPRADRLAGSRIALDMANGATTTTAVPLLRRLGFDVVTAGDTPDGRNINLDCGSTHPGRLAALVVDKRCRLGVAFDGDGDRAILIDHEGRIVDGDAVMLMLALAYHRKGALSGNTVVATVMSNIGLELALKSRGVSLLRTAVGDKYVMEEMLRGGFVLGGEQSGHVIMTEHLPTGDGLATALAVLRTMDETGLELQDLAADLVTYPQTLVNVRVRQRVPVASVPAVQAAIDDVERAIDGRGRLLIRYSGTEPLLRIMIEGQNLDEIKGWAERIAGAVYGMPWREGRAVIALSVNLNKVATLRNARGGSEPSVLTAVGVALDAGAPGITVHPRADERHITRRDVIEVAELLATRRAAGLPSAEFNIEGDPRPDLIDLVVELAPHQCTLVPVMPGEITSQAGWPPDTAPHVLSGAIDRLRTAGVRVSVFVEPELASIRWAAGLGTDRVELYTEPFAKAYARDPGEARTMFSRYVDAATLAHELGLGVNAGHDLDLENLTLFRLLPHLDEVSIGHALMTHALWVGLTQSVKDYLAVLSAT